MTRLGLLPSPYPDFPLPENIRSASVSTTGTHHRTASPITAAMSSSIFLRSAMRSFRAIQPVSRALRPVPAIQAFRPIAPVFAQRHYAGEGSLAKDEVETRIIEILKGFDKVTDPAKVRFPVLDSDFQVCLRSWILCEMYLSRFDGRLLELHISRMISDLIVWILWKL